MTDRTNSLLVVLDSEYRVDDVEMIMAAITMIRGVLKVSYNTSSHEHYAAKVQARNEIKQKIWELLK